MVTAVQGIVADAHSLLRVFQVFLDISRACVFFGKGRSTLSAIVQLLPWSYHIHADIFRPVLLE